MGSSEREFTMRRLTWLEVARGPFVALDPGGLNASIRTEGNLHAMATVDHIESTIFRGHFIHGHQDGEMLDIFDVCVGVGIDVRGESA